MIIPTKFLELPGNKSEATDEEWKAFNKSMREFYDFPIVDFRQQFRDKIEKNPDQIADLVLQTSQESQFKITILLSVIEQEYPQYLKLAKQVLVVA